MSPSSTACDGWRGGLDPDAGAEGPRVLGVPCEPVHCQGSCPRDMGPDEIDTSPGSSSMMTGVSSTTGCGTFRP